MAAHVARDEDQDPTGRTVRDFIAELRGLTRSGKQKFVLAETETSGVTLATLIAPTGQRAWTRSRSALPPGLIRSHIVREMNASMPLDVPADTSLSGEEFFRTEGAYTSLGAPISGGRVGNWLLREGPHIDSDVEMFD